jgi:LPPG:FO 2-phospho-L-lactate transferase
MSARIVVLTGGVGGAKLVDGLYRDLPPGSLTAIVNTGDDFRHLGLAVSPDIDTLLYTLSGKANRQQGWGREGETWQFMDALRSVEGPGWFQLGDGDLALHVMRSHLLEQGTRLSTVIGRFAEAWGLDLQILPMSDDGVATVLETDQGALPFQTYFVERRCAPAVRAIRFEGADSARAQPDALAAIAAADAILIAPSNPWLSIDPLLAIGELRSALANAPAPVVAVSPLVGGDAVKGPTAKLMRELGLAVNNAAIAEHYAGIIDALIVHDGDDRPDGLPTLATNTLMRSDEDRVRLARTALDMARTLRE